MDASVSDSISDRSAQPQHYALHFREGPRGGFIWRYRDEGVVLTPLAMTWTANGLDRTALYADVVQVRLQTGHIPRSGTFGTCIVTFRNGRDVTINSLNGWGSPDDDRLDDYAEFLQDFHARLSDADRERIRFLAGGTVGRKIAGQISLALGAAMFFVLPLVLLVWTGELEALFLALGGLGFLFPVFRTLKKNEPRTYDPSNLEEDLFPHT